MIKNFRNDVDDNTTSIKPVYVWVARDEDEELYLFIKNPEIKKNEALLYFWSAGDYIGLNKGLFSNITFRTSPVKFALVEVKEYAGEV